MSRELWSPKFSLGSIYGGAPTNRARWGEERDNGETRGKVCPEASKTVKFGTSIARVLFFLRRASRGRGEEPLAPLEVGLIGFVN